MLVIMTIATLTYTVIQQRQALEELQVEIKTTQAITIGYVKAYVTCKYNLEQAIRICSL